MAPGDAGGVGDTDLGNVTVAAAVVGGLSGEGTGGGLFGCTIVVGTASTAVGNTTAADSSGGAVGGMAGGNGGSEGGGLSSSGDLSPPMETFS